MSEENQDSTQRQIVSNLETELAAVGFEHARLVGRGGFGAVYRCRQPSLDRVVAVKVLDSAPEDVDRARFFREQLAMGRLSGHPNIVHVLESGVTETGRPFIVMPFHPRDSLEVWVRENGPLSVADALDAGVKLSGALETAHRAGVLHRDVKPANVLLSEYGEPQLSDFGIARIAGGDDTTRGVLVGSPAYTAPELLHEGEPSVLSDVYGLAATLFTALDGRPAFARRRGEHLMSQLRRIGAEPLPDLRGKGVPDPLCTVIDQALARVPEDRPRSAAEFGSLLRAVGEELGMVVADLPVPLSHERKAGPFRLTGIVADEYMHSGGRTPGGRPPSASTRFRPPVITHAMVARRHLLSTIREAGRARLVLIHGPAGFGKTTLAAQRIQELEREGVATAWLSIDEDDNTVAWFLAHLAEAVGRVEPAVAAEMRSELDVPGEDVARHVLTSLINRLHEANVAVAVVLDDWHRVTSDSTRKAAAFLLDHGCHHLQLIVTSRNSLGLPLSTMRVRRELVEIDSSALRFDADESSELLVDHCGLALAEDDVHELEMSTDGWAAALQLASLALRDHPDPHSLISHISGRHRAIGEYLTENVVDGLESRLLDFVLTTSVTERLCAGLARALTGERQAQALLEEIEQRDLFLYRLDEDGEWFRYHHLFADFLRRRLERDAPDRVAEVHRAAAQWFTGHDMVRQAVDHWLLAGDAKRAVDLVEDVSIDYLERSDMWTLIGLADKLPEAALRSHLALRINVAYAHAILHHREDALAILRQVDLLLAIQGNDEETEDRRTESALVRAAIGAFDDKLDGIAEVVARASVRTTTLAPWQLCGTADLGSFAALYGFDFEEALRWQRWAIPFHQRSSGPFSEIYGFLISGIAVREQLNLATAEALFQHGRELVHDLGGPTTYVGRLTGSLLGELLYEQGHLTDAERLLDQSHTLGAEGGTVEFLLATYGIGARVKFLAGTESEARELLDEGADVAARLNLPRLAARVENERIRCGFGPTRAKRAIVASGRQALAEVHNGIQILTAELEEDSAIRLLLSDGAAAAACARADLLVDSIDAARRPRASLFARLIRAEAMAAAGREADARTEVLRLLDDCADSGLRRPFLDSGPHVRDIVERLRDQPSPDIAPRTKLTTYLADIGSTD
ncbi:serine/threonine-protein kinase [Antrihabitans sp. YC2-6]|uniref:serine/threonine-protein kinase n=1 Tax=Antrihabitans sp. YC2-6 TaxID=2799498 RepID=UPI0018F79652|nr:serine/threonine-protein kinase [Antrihabitans sp. YC2-6]MBJ8343837.1 protein kinase [Antrihabitans sp. YC2-6]